MSERPKENASKAFVGASPPRVQIPPPPPLRDETPPGRPPGRGSRASPVIEERAPNTSLDPRRVGCSDVGAQPVRHESAPPAVAATTARRRGESCRSCQRYRSRSSGATASRCVPVTSARTDRRAGPRTCTGVPSRHFSSRSRTGPHPASTFTRPRHPISSCSSRSSASPSVSPGSQPPEGSSSMPGRKSSLSERRTMSTPASECTTAPATNLSIPGTCVLCSRDSFTPGRVSSRPDRRPRTRAGTRSCSSCGGDPPPALPLYRSTGLLGCHSPMEGVG